MVFAPVMVKIFVFWGKVRGFWRILAKIRRILRSFAGARGLLMGFAKICESAGMFDGFCAIFRKCNKKPWANFFAQGEMTSVVPPEFPQRVTNGHSRSVTASGRGRLLRGEGPACSAVRSGATFPWSHAQACTSRLLSAARLPGTAPHRSVWRFCLL